MKKKVASLLLAVILLWAGLLPGQPAQAATVYFMAVNDTIYPSKLEEATMPFVSGGIVYVPYAIFSKNSTGIDLDTSTLSNAQKETVSIFSSQLMITFSLTEKTAWDQDGNKRTEYAIVNQGQVFVPAAAVCSYFGLSYSLVRTDYGRVVRICNGQAVIPTANFASAAASLLAKYLADYQQSIAPAPSPSPSDSPAPTTSPAVTPSPAIDNKGSLRVAYLVEDAAAFDSALVTSVGYGLYPLFLFRPEDMPQMAAAVRRAVGSGCRVGLWVEGDNHEELSAALHRGNALLKKIAWTETHIFYTTSSATAQMLSAGWCLWNRTPANATSQGVLKAVRQDSNDTARVTLPLNQNTARALPGILATLQQEHYYFAMTQETDGYFK